MKNICTLVIWILTSVTIKINYWHEAYVKRFKNEDGCCHDIGYLLMSCIPPLPPTEYWSSCGVSYFQFWAFWWQVKRLLDEGMDANVAALGPKSHGLTPLHLAAKGGHIKVMDELLERGANIDARTKGACGCKWWYPYFQLNVVLFLNACFRAK